ncbi:hypothetical protein [Pseudoalteromonas sp. T1lg76]|uniref:hypothetical protein n=1 Tax=Pseudoalteromonas sp. T1lg76 TaxID=2077103 RepID=UPI001319DC1A|nr:hypothetical protein [Pseudoalteromonas sp. T1lg76]
MAVYARLEVAMKSIIYLIIFLVGYVCISYFSGELVFYPGALPAVFFLYGSVGAILFRWLSARKLRIKEVIFIPLISIGLMLKAFDRDENLIVGLGLSFMLCFVLGVALANWYLARQQK